MNDERSPTEIVSMVPVYVIASMKGVKRILLGALAVTLVAAALLLAWSDEAIEPEVMTALAPPPPVAPVLNLFHPLVGFAVALDTDPAAEGEAAVTRVNRLIRSDNATQGDPAIALAWVVPVAKLHDPQSVLCVVRADDCLAQLWSRRGELDQVMTTNASLLARFRALAAFPYLQNTVDPDPRAPLPDFSLLLAIHRLVVARAVIGYLQRDADARDELIADITFLRRMLRQADNVILKMVAASMLADALHGYAALLNRPDSAPVSQPEVAALTDAEMSLDTALSAEFRSIASGIRSLSRDGSVHSEMGIPTWFDGVLLNPLFKPNRSLNLAAPMLWDDVTKTLHFVSPRPEAGYNRLVLTPIVF